MSILNPPNITRISDKDTPSRQLKVNEDGSIISITPECDKLNAGGAWSATSILSNLEASASMYIEIITPIGKQVNTQAYSISSDKLIKSEFYENPTSISDGSSEIKLIQRHRRSTDLVQPLTKIYTNPTNVTTGDNMLRILVFGGIENQNHSINPLPFSTDPLGFDLKENTKYVVKLTNLSSSVSTIIFWNLEVYEF